MQETEIRNFDDRINTKCIICNKNSEYTTLGKIPICNKCLKKKNIIYCDICGCLYTDDKSVDEVICPNCLYVTGPTNDLFQLAHNIIIRQSFSN